MKSKILVFYKTTAEIQKEAEKIARQLKADLQGDHGNLIDTESRHDVIIPIGGDGTVLHAETQYPGIPKLPLGAGRLDFLSSAPLNKWKEIISLFQKGNYSTEERLKIDLSKHSSLNEINFTKSSPGQLCTMEVYLDQKHRVTLRGDGVIVATPTGSTAYALSAGGSIIDPTLEVITIISVAPFTGFTKPLILPASKKIKLVSQSEGTLVIDGSTLKNFSKGAEFIITRSSISAKFIRFDHQPNLYQKLQLLD